MLRGMGLKLQMTRSWWLSCLCYVLSCVDWSWRVWTCFRPGSIAETCFQSWLQGLAFSPGLVAETRLCS
jgi:hypothetical protein